MAEARLPVIPRSCASFYVRNVGEVSLVEIGGEIDMSNASTLGACMSVFEPNESVIVDLSGVEFIDSTGIAVFAVTARRGVRLVCRGAHGGVRKVLLVCGLDQLITFEDCA